MSLGGFGYDTSVGFSKALAVSYEELGGSYDGLEGLYELLGGR